MSRTPDKKAPPAGDPPRVPRRSAAYAMDPVVACAWLYYEDQMTQSEIAEALGVSRATVVNQLQLARDRGVVQVTIQKEHMLPLQLSRALRERFGLEDCVVIPDDAGRRPPSQRVGEAGAWLLSTLLEPGDVLGVAWGQTVLALSKAMQGRPIKDLSVVQIAGSMMATYEFSPELCTSNIASRLQARCVNLHAPALLSTPGVRDLLCNEPSLREQLALSRRCNKIVFGVADVEPDSIVFGSGLCRPDDLGPYLSRGTVAVLAGRFMDRYGQPVLDHLDDRMIGLSLAEIRAVPIRLCIAAGPRKAQAIHAALTGGYASVLVTDESTAEGIIAIPDASVPARNAANTKAGREPKSSANKKSSHESIEQVSGRHHGRQLRDR